MRLLNFFKKAWHSREARKFFRNKMAVASLLIVAFYCLVALAVMFGAVTKQQCGAVVGPVAMKGFFQQPLPEKRYDRAISGIYSGVERALKRKNQQAALNEVSMGAYRVADKPVAQLQQTVDEVKVLLKKFEVSENLDKDPQMMPLLEELESKVDTLREPLTSEEEFSRNVALCLGTDSQGRSIFLRGVYSIKIALQVGLITATISVLLGTFMGAAAGYFGGWVDHLVVWLYTTFSSIPSLVLLVVIAYAFLDLEVEIPFTSGGKSESGRVLLKDTLFPVYIALCATFWIGTCRVIRGETLKLKQLEYVQAARTAGFGSMHVLLRHVIPNTAHLVLINFSLLLIGAIKTEVILSFLGLGVKSQPSWGIMIKDAGSNGDVMNGFFWQIGTATAFMFFLVLAFNILSDALQDALDPKHL